MEIPRINKINNNIPRAVRQNLVVMLETASHKIIMMSLD